MVTDLFIFFFKDYAYRYDHGVLWVFAIAIAIFWIWSATYVANKNAEDPTRKICWLIIVLFFGPLGSALYFLCGREKDYSVIEMDGFKEWIEADPSRAYLSKNDQLEAFENYKKTT